MEIFPLCYCSANMYMKGFVAAPLLPFVWDVFSALHHDDLLKMYKKTWLFV